MTNRIIRRLRNGNLTTEDLKAMDSTEKFVEFHDAHYHTYVGYKIYQITGGKSLYQIKNEHIDRQHEIEREWHNTYPQIGDRVVFRSVDKAGTICDGYGYVKNVHVHDFRTGYALYTVKLEDIGNDEKDIYQLYSNRPGQEDKEWIKRV